MIENNTTYPLVELCFLDKRENAIKLTGRLYTKGVQDSLSYTINGKEKTATLRGFTEINDTCRYIFEIYLDRSAISERASVPAHS